MDATDAELLAAFARNRSEDAFGELLRRHLGMVFATARRLVGDAHEAEEVAQTVFQLFAEKAGTIAAGQPLAGWLYHAARHHALHRVRSEGRRRQREQFAAAMNPATESAPPPPLLAELEEVLTELAADERDVLVLRFLEDRELREVGRELGVSEEAARKRVARALERLREVFARRGITASTGAITVALLGQAGVGVPATLGATITTSVLGGTAVAAATTALVTETTATTMNLFNLKTAAAILGAAAMTGTTTYVVQERRADQLRADYQTLNKTHGKLAAEQQEARELIQLRDEQIAVLKRNVEDLPRLRGEVDALRRANLDLEDKARLLAAAGNPRVLDERTAYIEALEIARQADEKQRSLFRNRRFMVAASYARLLQQALMTVAEANGGEYPHSLSVALEHLGPKMYHEGLKIDNTLVSATDFEIVYQGNVLDIADPANTLLFRERIPFSIGDGKTVRISFFANGRVENVEEIYLPSGELEVRRPRDPSADYE